MVQDTEFVSMVDCLAHAFVIYFWNQKKILRNKLETFYFYKNIKIHTRNTLYNKIQEK